MTKQHFEQLAHRSARVHLAGNFAAAVKTDMQEKFATLKAKTHADATAAARTLGRKIQAPKQSASADWRAGRTNIAAERCALKRARPA